MERTGQFLESIALRYLFWCRPKLIEVAINMHIIEHCREYLTLSCTLTSACRSSKQVTASECPRAAARCKAVAPCYRILINYPERRESKAGLARHLVCNVDICLGIQESIDQCHFISHGSPMQRCGHALPTPTISSGNDYVTLVITSNV